MKKLTKVRRKEIYKYIQMSIRSAPSGDMNETNIFTMSGPAMINFCKLIPKYYRQTSFKDFGTIQLESFPELAVKKPFECWSIDRNFWFHPYEKLARLELITNVIIDMKITWWDKLVDRWHNFDGFDFFPFE